MHTGNEQCIPIVIEEGLLSAKLCPDASLSFLLLQPLGSSERAALPCSEIFFVLSRKTLAAQFCYNLGEWCF
jgi:hypothetical protein